MNGALVSYCIHTLRLCGFAIASTVLGPVMLAVLPQGVEVLRTMTDTALTHAGTQPDEFGRVFFFLVALFFWSLSNWYGARMLVQRHFGNLLPGAPLPAEVRWRTWLPRALILIGWFPIALMLARIGETLVAAGATVSCGLALLYALFRRRLPWWLFGSGLSMAAAKSSVGHQKLQLPEGELLMLVLAGLTSVVGLVGLSAGNFGVARMLGAAGLALLALAMWSLALTVLLVYLPKAWGWPAFTGFAVLAALVFANLGWTSNHGIAARRVDADLQTRAPRPEAYQYWQRWRKTPSWPDKGPIYIVAAEGGASRSAWWTGHVLSVLDDVTDGDFGKRVFAVSGVSGGSLGLAAWVAMRKDRADQAIRIPAAPMPAASPPFIDASPAAGVPVLPASSASSATVAGAAADWGLAPDTRACEGAVQGEASPESVRSACFLGGDFVSTVLAYMLGVDLVQRITPTPVAAWDRSLGLEATWSRDWWLRFGSNHFARPLLELYDAKDGVEFPRTDLPLLLLNTTTAGQGRPMLQAPVRIASPEVDDLLDPLLRTSGLTLTGAVHNSARFPYVSPGGDVVTANGMFYDSVVDGGYVENSGALGLATLMRVLQADAARDNQSEAWQQFVNRVVVIFIANDPDEPLVDIAKLCTKDSSVLDLTPRAPLGELGTPPLGLYKTRSGRATVERRSLLREFGMCPSDVPVPGQPGVVSVPSPWRAHFISMGSQTVKEFQPAMSWFMRPEAREKMWRAVAAPPAKPQMALLLERWAKDTQNDPATAMWRLSRFGKEQ